MPDLGMLIRQVRREAAALPTDELRREIEIGLAIQDAAIGQYLAVIRPGAGVEEVMVATGTVLVSVLTTALYVRELTARPAPRAGVTFSSN
jgi:hypothetical protein